MRKSIIIITLLLFLSLVTCHTSYAQQAKSEDEVPQPSAEQQKTFTAAQIEAQKRFDEYKVIAQQASDLPSTATVQQRIESLYQLSVAESRSQLAAEHVSAILYYIMAQQKLSPDNYRAIVNKDGKLQFHRLSTSAVPSPSSVP